MKSDWGRIIGWAIPLLCISLAAYLIFGGSNKLRAANQRLASAQFAESTAAAAKDLAEKQTGTIRVAAIGPSVSEEPKFLNGLRGHAAMDHVQITKWTGHPPAPVAGLPTGALVPDPATADPAIKSLVGITGEITLDGPYQGIRDFLNTLSNSNRLYLLSDMRWTRNKAGVELTTTITRYIDPSLSPTDAEPGSPKRS